MKKKYLKLTGSFLFMMIFYEVCFLLNFTLTWKVKDVDHFVLSPLLYQWNKNKPARVVYRNSSTLETIIRHSKNTTSQTYSLPDVRHLQVNSSRPILNLTLDKHLHKPKTLSNVAGPSHKLKSIPQVFVGSGKGKSKLKPSYFVVGRGKIKHFGKVIPQKPKNVFAVKSSQSYEKTVADAVHGFVLKNTSKKDDLINKHNYIYHQNSNICNAAKLHVLIVIHSAIKNAPKRNKIRNSWGAITYRNTSIGIVFMLGLDEKPNNSLLKEISREAEESGDIVQGNFIDSYRNISYKHIMALHWMTSHCDDVRTVVKIDDDVFVNVFKLVDFAISVGHVKNSLLCSVLPKQRPHRAGKWSISKVDYPFMFYPPYCEGFAYIFSMNEARKLVKASEDMRFCWIDDVFVTGILAERAGVKRKRFPPDRKGVKSAWYKRENSVEADRVMFFTEFKDWEALSVRVHGTSNRNNSESSNVTSIHV